VDTYDIIFLLIFLVVWFLFVKVILPKLGVST